MNAFDRFESSNPHSLYLPAEPFSSRPEQVNVILDGATKVIDAFYSSQSPDRGQLIAATGAGKTMMASAILATVIHWVDQTIMAYGNNPFPRAHLYATPSLGLNAQAQSDLIKNITSLLGHIYDSHKIKIFIQDSADHDEEYSHIFHQTQSSGSFLTAKQFVDGLKDGQHGIVICCNPSLHHIKDCHFGIAVADEAHRLALGEETNKEWFDNVSADFCIFQTGTRIRTPSRNYDMMNPFRFGEVFGVINYQQCFNNGSVIRPNFHRFEVSSAILEDRDIFETTKIIPSTIFDEFQKVLPIHAAYSTQAGSTKQKILVAASTAYGCTDAITNWYKFSHNNKFAVFVAISNSDKVKKYFVSKNHTIYTCNGKEIQTRKEWLELIHIAKYAVVFNYDIFREGIDIPSFTAELIARNMSDNQGKMCQYAGRIMRKDFGTNITINQFHIQHLGHNIDTTPNPNKIPQILYLSQFGNSFIDEHFLNTQVFDNQRYGYEPMLGFTKESKEGGPDNNLYEIEVTNREWREQTAGVDLFKYSKPLTCNISAIF